MKKLVNLLLSLTVILALTGCGKEQIVTYSKTMVESDLSMTDTLVLKAKGDILQEINQTINMDLSKLDSEIVDMMIPMYDETYGQMKDTAPESVSITYGQDGDSYVVTLNINLVDADLQALNKDGYITLSTEDADKVKFISLKQTADAYVASGYTLQE